MPELKLPRAFTFLLVYVHSILKEKSVMGRGNFCNERRRFILSVGVE